MKKLSFIFAMVFAASFAMAQNTAIINATGSFQEQTILQGAANNNYGRIIQTVPGGISNVFGEQTEAIIEQVSANKGYINQGGTRQVATIYQNFDNYSTTDQRGSWNGSITYLGADHNFSKVEQDGKQNNAYIRSTSNWNGTALNPLNIYQLGNNNLADIYSGWNPASSNGNLASIVQTGDWNESTLRQEGGDFNKATIYQGTSSNDANLTQSGSYLVATIDQYGGTNNIVNLKQTGGVVDIDQIGIGNKVQGLQSVPELWASFAGATLDVLQIGDNNTLDLKSASPSAIVDVFQDGMTNAALVVQD